MQHAGGMLLPPVQKLVASSIFAKWQKCKQIWLAAFLTL